MINFCLLNKSRNSDLTYINHQDEFDEKLPADEMDEIDELLPDLNSFPGFISFLTGFSGLKADNTAAPAAAPKPKPYHWYRWKFLSSLQVSYTIIMSSMRCEF